MRSALLLAALLSSTPASAIPVISGGPRASTDLPGGAVSEFGSGFALKAVVDGPEQDLPGALAIFDARPGAAANQRLGTLSLRVSSGGAERLNGPRKITFHRWGWEESLEDAQGTARVRVFTVARDVFGVVLDTGVDGLALTANLAGPASAAVASAGTAITVELGSSPATALAWGASDASGARAGTMGAPFETSLQRPIVAGEALGLLIAFGASGLEAQALFDQTRNTLGAPGSWFEAVGARWGPDDPRLALEQRAEAVLAMNAAHPRAGFPSKTQQNNFTIEDLSLQTLAHAHRSAAAAFDDLEVLQLGQLSAGVDEGMIPDQQGATFSHAPTHALSLRRAFERSDRTEEARGRLERLYASGQAFANWWFVRRDHDGDGVPELDGSREGGGRTAVFDEAWGAVETDPVGASHPRPKLNSVELNAWLYLYEVELSRVARLLGKADEADVWIGRAGRLGIVFEDSEQGFWDEQRGGYFDYLRSPARTFLRARTPSLWSPLFVGAIRDRSRVTRVAEQILDPESFWGEHGVPSTAFNEPTFEPGSPRRGAISPVQNYLTVLALYRYGFEPEAEELKVKLLTLLAREHGFWEAYDARTGAGVGLYGHSTSASVAIELLHDRHQAEAFAVERGGVAAKREGFLRRLFRASDGRILVEVSVEGSLEVPRTIVESKTQLFSDEPIAFRFEDPRQELLGKKVKVTLPLLADAEIVVTRGDGSTEELTLKQPVAIELDVVDRLEVKTFHFTGHSGCGCGMAPGAALLAVLALVGWTGSRRTRRR